MLSKVLVGDCDRLKLLWSLMETEQSHTSILILFVQTRTRALGTCQQLKSQRLALNHFLVPERLRPHRLETYVSIKHRKIGAATRLGVLIQCTKQSLRGRFVLNPVGRPVTILLMSQGYSVVSSDASSKNSRLFGTACSYRTPERASAIA